MRDLFEQYSALSGKLHFMDEHEYQKFMKENKLINETLSKITLSLMFSKNNRSKESAYRL